MRRRHALKTTISVLAICLAIFAAAVAFPCAAQTMQVDITPAHVTNHFAPNQALGAGVDRIAQEAIDKDLVQPALDRALSSGWQPVSFRQNTELAVEAWHWNPQGTWSDASGKGYFTGSGNPTEFLRYYFRQGVAPRRCPLHRCTGQFRIFTADGRRRKQLLEKQSIPYAALHG